MRHRRVATKSAAFEVDLFLGGRLNACRSIILMKQVCSGRAARSSERTASVSDCSATIALAHNSLIRSSIGSISTLESRYRENSSESDKRAIPGDL